MATPLDLTALLQEPSKADVADLRRRARAGEFGPTGLAVGRMAFLVGAMLIYFVATVFTMILPALRRGASGLGGLSTSEWTWLGFLVVMSVLCGCVIIPLLAGRNNWLRIALFARANGLGFRRRSNDPLYPGTLFGRGDSRQSINHVWSATGRLADAGTYRFTTGSGKSKAVHQSAFAAFRLPRPLPHLVLDSRGNDALTGSGLPGQFASSQRITLGEPFDSYYTLYAPEGYGADAFRMFPPDLMQRLIDLPAVWDIEIVDTWLFLYAPALDFTAPSTWQTIELVNDTIAERVGRLADRYVDDRSLAYAGGQPVALTSNPGRPGVPIAPQGRRLKTGWGRGTIFMFVTFGLMLLAQFVLPLWLRGRG